MRSLNELVNEALMKWAAVTKTNPEGPQSFRGTWSQYELTEHLKELNLSRDLDITGLTTFMMLRGLTEAYLRTITFSAEELILEHKRVGKEIAPMHELREVLEDPLVLELISEFQEKIRKAAELYGVPENIKIKIPKKKNDQWSSPDDVKEEDRHPKIELEDILKKKYTLSYVRRDALKSMQNLEAHQFTQGAKDTEPLKLNRYVWEFWNINSFVKAMQTQAVSGISLALIRDPEEVLHSYFVFGVRNGETITVLTDRTEGPHPLFNRMARRPDRELERRAALHWFPYHLLDLAVSLDGKQVYAKARTSLVPINTKAVPLIPIGELESEQFIWLILISDLIRDKYWVQDHKLPELSYTGEMVREPNSLVGEHGALAKSGLYKPLIVPQITKADVTLEKTKAQWESESTKFNQWMVDRYGNKVPDILLNPIGQEEGQKLLDVAQKELGIQKLSRLDKYGLDKYADALQLEHFSPVTFGTKEKLEQDRVWVGRVNQMKVIQQLAIKEYEKEKDSIRTWYEKQITKNSDFLIEAMVRGELKIPVYSSKGFEHGSFKRKMEDAFVLSGLGSYPGDAFKKHKQDSSFFGKHVYLHGGYDSLTNKFGRVRCFLDKETLANVWGKFSPKCPEALAILCGVKEDELPWPLQHWFGQEEPYSGNHILLRLDPSDWVLQNPWKDEGYAILIGICKSSFTRKRKELGLPKLDIQKRVLEKE